MKDILSGYEGAVVGAAVADAVGAPLEFYPPLEIKALFEENPYLTKNMNGGGAFNWEPGQTTDDTDMALAIVDSIVANGRYDPSDIAERFVWWMQSMPKDIGGLTRNSLKLVADGVSYRKSGEVLLASSKRPPIANGSVMRTYPIGLLFRGNLPKMFKASDEISAITHAHSECLTACRMTCDVVANLASGVDKAALPNILAQDFKDTPAIDQLIEDAMTGETHRKKNRGYGGAFESFNIAFNSLMTTNNFADAINRSISFGYDTDTQATVTGAFAGALYGIEGIPIQWREQLNAYDLAVQSQMGTDALRAKAKGLYTLNQRLIDQKPIWRRWTYVI